MNIINATYSANYDDYNGYDEVLCEVDTDTMEVIRFVEVLKSRCVEDTDIACVSESIELDDGREFEALKFDEYEDAVDGGFADEYERENIILFDADALEEIMDDFTN